MAKHGIGQRVFCVSNCSQIDITGRKAFVYGTVWENSSVPFVEWDTANGDKMWAEVQKHLIPVEILYRKF